MNTQASILGATLKVEWIERHRYPDSVYRAVAEKEHKIIDTGHETVGLSGKTRSRFVVSYVIILHYWRRPSHMIERIDPRVGDVQRKVSADNERGYEQPCFIERRWLDPLETMEFAYDFLPRPTQNMFKRLATMILILTALLIWAVRN